MKKIALLLILTTLLLAACGKSHGDMPGMDHSGSSQAGQSTDAKQGGDVQANVTLQHIHGLGYTSDGKGILLPAHTGIVTYSDGKWQNVNAPKHDYMGFVTVDNGFYSSGHPAAGSKLKDPMGIVKSADMGKTLTTLGFEGESDFHGMTVGYKSHAIYVLNGQPNARMKTPGMYYSKDDAKTWQKSEISGLDGVATALATHPTDDKIVAVGTKVGLFVSGDSGNHFESLVPQSSITSLAFDSKGELFVASENSPTMLQINVSTHAKKEVPLPKLDQNDGISYIAINPINVNEVALASFSKDVFLSKDSGGNWTKIADKGKGN